MDWPPWFPWVVGFPVGSALVSYGLAALVSLGRWVSGWFRLGFLWIGRLGFPGSLGFRLVPPWFPMDWPPWFPWVVGFPVGSALVSYGLAALVSLGCWVSGWFRLGFLWIGRLGFP